MLDILSIKPIGHIRSCFPEKFGIPKQGRLSPNSQGAIVFSPHIDVVAMTAGLKTFSHLWVLWWFHQNKNKTVLKKIHPPRLNGKKIGIFASRSPHHPNPIGMTVVSMLSIHNNEILISGIDMVDQTPVLDIKPYIPQWDAYPEASSGWLDSEPEYSFSPILSPSAKNDIYLMDQAGALPQPAENIIAAIKECLCFDPRPPAYKKENSNKTIHAFQIFGLDIEFTYQPRQGCVVTRIKMN